MVAPRKTRAEMGSASLPHRNNARGRPARTAAHDARCAWRPGVQLVGVVGRLVGRVRSIGRVRAWRAVEWGHALARPTAPDPPTPPNRSKPMELAENVREYPDHELAALVPLPPTTRTSTRAERSRPSSAASATRARRVSRQPRASGRARLHRGDHARRSRKHRARLAAFPRGAPTQRAVRGPRVRVRGQTARAIGPRGPQSRGPCVRARGKAREHAAPRPCGIRGPRTCARPQAARLPGGIGVRRARCGIGFADFVRAGGDARPRCRGRRRT